MQPELKAKLEAAATAAGRSLNAELVARLEQSLNAGSDNDDIRMVFDILERLSIRNPHLRYSFSFSTGDDSEPGMLAANPPASESESSVNQRTRLGSKPRTTKP